MNVDDPELPLDQINPSFNEEELLAKASVNVITLSYHSTSVGEMANFDHQNKFKNLYSMDRGDKWEQTDSKIMNFGGLVLEI
jgi:hypothetical protein